MPTKEEVIAQLKAKSGKAAPSPEAMEKSIEDVTGPIEDKAKLKEAEYLATVAASDKAAKEAVADMRKGRAEAERVFQNVKDALNPSTPDGHILFGVGGHIVTVGLIRNMFN